MTKLRVIIFNVAHGFCAFVNSPNGYSLLYDCGKTDKFSPIKYIKEKETLTPFNYRDLAYFVLSHPHDDHIEDIDRLTTDLEPAIICRQTYDWNDIKQGDVEEEYENLDTYSEWQKKYNQSVQLPDWGMDLYIGPYLSPTGAEKLSEGNFVNNSSIPLFIAYKGWKIAITGDLEKNAWLELLEDKTFQERLGGTHFFVASHHGHSSGYCKEIYQVMGKPFVNIVSVHSRDENVEAAYSSSDNARGIELNGKIRHMLTTRADGSIIIEIGEDGRATYSAQHFADNSARAAQEYRIW